MNQFQYGGDFGEQGGQYYNDAGEAYGYQQQGYYDDQGGIQGVPGEEQMAGSSEVPQEGVWGNQTSAMFDDENNSITSLAYDGCYERVWAGHKNGRVMSLKYAEDMETGMVDMDRYTSFMSGKNMESVVDLHPVQEYIISTSGSSVRMHTDGGMVVGNIGAQEMIVTPGSPVETVSFKCSTLFTNNGGMMTSAPMMPSHVITGTKKNIALAYDLTTFGNKPLLTYDVKCATECITQGGMYMAAGGNDGKVRLLDTRLRSSVVQHTLNAHTGPVLDVCLQPNEYTMYTCGKVARSINVHDPNAPKKMVPDPLVRVFDLRMNRQVAPLSMTTASPCFIKFIPTPASQGGYGSQILLGASNGLMQICDPLSQQQQGGIADPSSVQYVYSTLSSPRDTVMSAAASSSGQLLCTGNYSGGITQFALGLPPMESGAVPVRTVNEQSAGVPKYTATVPAAALRIHVDRSDALPSAYSLNISAQHAPSLSSAYSNTPHALTKSVKLFSKQIISSDLTQDMKKSDFIGFIPNPGFKSNSMLTAGSNTVEGKRAYAVCDPRKKSDVETDGAASAMSTSSSAGEDGTAGIGIMAGGFSLPAHYQRQQSYRGKQRMNRFDYASLNSTYLMALENTAPNSYTNTILQFMAAIPAVWGYAAKSQASLYHHNNPHTLWAELGFFFHMVWGIERQVRDEQGTVVEEDSTQRVVTPSNFQRTFQCIPEAVALGLFDGSLLTVQNRVQVFLRFFLSQLHKENVQGARAGSTTQNLPQGKGVAATATTTGGPQASLISEIFGFSIVSVTQFLQSGTQEAGIPNQAFTFDLVYPSKGGPPKRKPPPSQQSLPVAVGGSGDAAPVDQALEAAKLPAAEVGPPDLPASFACAVWGSLRKETSMRGWCDASKAYEPFKQVRSMVTLPQIVTFLCGETSRDPVDTTISGAMGEVKSQGSMHQLYWSSKTAGGGSWLPFRLEVAMLHPEDPKAQSRLVVSALLTAEGATDEMWSIFDGATDKLAHGPASNVQGYGIAATTGWTVHSLELSAVISQINACENATVAQQHAVLHARRAPDAASRVKESDKDWVLANDLCLRYADAAEVVTFDTWRHPCAVFFTQTTFGFGVKPVDTSSPPEASSVPASVLQLPSSSTVQCARLTSAEIPPAGHLVAFDGEFVSVALEQADTNADGQKVLVQESRQNLARYSLVDGGVVEEQAPLASAARDKDGKLRIVADDYIIPSETIVDYLTRFSGLVAEDLQPAVSRNAVVPNRTAYLKLRFFADNGCIFVGHGLDKDFETANIFVPRDQIIDTVELWRLPNQRKLALRFLAAYVLKEDIQDEIHDSIEDAKTALLLYRTYQGVAAQGFNHLQTVLQELYTYGTKSNWSIRQDLIEEHFASAASASIDVVKV